MFSRPTAERVLHIRSVRRQYRRQQVARVASASVAGVRPDVHHVDDVLVNDGVGARNDVVLVVSDHEVPARHIAEVRPCTARA